MASVTLVSPSWVLRELAGMLFVYSPCVFEVTLTVIVQVELGGIEALFNVNEVPPAAAASDAEGPHPLSVGETGFARKTPAGRSSVRDTWVSVVLVSLLLITMDN